MNTQIPDIKIVTVQMTKKNKVLLLLLCTYSFDKKASFKSYVIRIFRKELIKIKGYIYTL